MKNMVNRGDAMNSSAGRIALACLVVSVWQVLAPVPTALGQGVPAPRPLSGVIIEEPSAPGTLPDFDGGLLQTGHCASCGTGVLGGGLGRIGGGGMASASASRKWKRYWFISVWSLARRASGCCTKRCAFKASNSPALASINKATTSGVNSMWH